MRAIALFLGAGFSKPWGLPLTKDLLPVLEEKWRPIIEMFPKRYERQLATRVQANWLEYQSYCQGSVDEFVRMLQTGERGASDLSFKDLAYFLAMQLGVKQSIVREFNRQPQFTRHHIRMQWKILPAYNVITNELDNKPLRGIVTTNYDLVVKKILGPHATGRLGGFNYGRKGQPAQGKHQLSTQDWYGPTIINGTIPLLKLHGSLNWAESKRRIDVYVDCRPCLKKGLSPLIVPPRDSSHNEILSQIWQQASDVLKDADVWIFCGYSFPPYDNDVRGLLASSASNLRRVVILSPHATDVEQDVRDFLKASVSELEVKCGPGLGPELTSSKFSSLISGIDTD
jgi:SIR2-like domain